MEIIKLTRAEFDALPLGSLATMTEPTIGKRWKRRGAMAWYMAEIVDGGRFPEMEIYEIVIVDEPGQ